jgi:hypothetical protein
MVMTVLGQLFASMGSQKMSMQFWAKNKLLQQFHHNFNINIQLMH